MKSISGTGNNGEEQAKLGGLIEQSADGFLVIGADGVIRFANPSALALLTCDDEPLVGRPFGQPLIPGQSTELDMARGGRLRVAELRVSRAEWAGEPALLATLRDVTEQKRAMEALRFLAEAGSALARSLDQPAILAAVTDLVTSRLADVCIIDLAEGDSSILRVASRHADPELDAKAGSLVSPGPFKREESCPIGQVITDGRPRNVPDVGDSLLSSMAGDLGQFSVLRELAPRSALFVPLTARGRTLGVITLLSTSPSTRFGDEHSELAEELAQRAALALDNARLFEEAREAVRRRDEFLAVLAHELRNPLAPIAHSAAIMRIKAAGLPDLTRLIDVVERQSRQMARLLDDLLDVARVTRGAIRLELCPIDLRGVLEQAAQSCGPLLLGRRHQLDLALPPRPIAVEGDATRLEQVFVNLINNAAHYTPPGGTIQVEAFDVGPHAEVHVRDNGIGMTPETISRVFELFVHGEWEPTKTHEGLGVGLSLVRKLVEMHGGAVSAASPGPGRGSEFSIRLPALDRSLDADLAVPEAPRDPTSGLRIVLIEDVADNREMLRDLLVLWGHHVETAADGESGLELIRRSKPDLALVDVGLPGMSGLELAQQAASDPDLARTFLVALTGFAQTEDRRLAREAGFAAHIVKPVNLEELLQILARADMRSGGEPEC